MSQRSGERKRKAEGAFQVLSFFLQKKRKRKHARDRAEDYFCLFWETMPVSLDPNQRSGEETCNPEPESPPWLRAGPSELSPRARHSWTRMFIQGTHATHVPLAQRTKIQSALSIWGCSLVTPISREKEGKKNPTLPEEHSGLNANPRQLLMLNNVEDLLSLPAPPPPPQKRL